MLAQAVQSYLSVRRAAGYLLKHVGLRLKSFAAYADAKRQRYVTAEIAVEWARQSSSIVERARRLGDVRRFALYLHAEDERHEIPPLIFGKESRPRPTPYILSDEQICRIIQLAAQSGYRTLRRQTYSTLFALLACTGLRVSEAIRLRYDDITPDGLVIRATKFRKSRLVPLHHTARAGLDRYLKQRRAYAPFDDHVFISLRRKPLLIEDVDVAFRTRSQENESAAWTGTASADTSFSPGHAFAVRALLNCPDGAGITSRNTC